MEEKKWGLVQLSSGVRCRFVFGKYVAGCTRLSGKGGGWHKDKVPFCRKRFEISWLDVEVRPPMEKTIKSAPRQKEAVWKNMSPIHGTVSGGWQVRMGWDNCPRDLHILNLNLNLFMIFVFKSGGALKSWWFAAGRSSLNFIAPPQLPLK